MRAYIWTVSRVDQGQTIELARATTRDGSPFGGYVREYDQADRSVTYSRDGEVIDETDLPVDLQGFSGCVC